MSTASTTPGLVLSIVSHGQQSMLRELLGDLQRHVHVPISVRITENVPERAPLDVTGYSFPVEIIRNQHRLGFGANHNQAFLSGPCDLFCVMNPDLRLQNDPFPALLKTIARPEVGVVGSVVTNPMGLLEDHARFFPTPWELLRKMIGGGSSTTTGYLSGISPDWIAGMFMLFRAETYRAVGGFDEAYFLYYEDVDICARLWQRGLEVAVNADVRVVHDARRQSRRSMAYAVWHARSALRFFSRGYVRPARADLGARSARLR